MDGSSAWDLSRYTILIIVLALHLALVVLLARASRIGTPTASMQQSVEVVFLPPPILPKVRSDNTRPRRLSGETAITVAPPDLDSLVPSAQSSSGPNGRGAGVDWAAEARRALQAFEIRTHRPPSNSSVSGGPAEDNWWPRGRHRIGEQYKTANGDWIVWINDNCYQIALSGPSTALASETQPQTICPASSGASRDP
jgi:hypothetical protein